jgi:hypothetical protein
MPVQQCQPIMPRGVVHADKTYRIRSTAHRIPPWCTCSCAQKILGLSTNSISLVVYVLPAQLLEESGLVDRDSGHGGGNSRCDKKFWIDVRTIVLASVQSQKEWPWIFSRKETLHTKKPHSSGEEAQTNEMFVMTPIGLLEILPHQPHTATVVPLFSYERYRMVTLICDLVYQAFSRWRTANCSNLPAWFIPLLSLIRS